ncbi:MAG: cyclase family protein [Pseudomonadota bacterium]
MSNKQRTSMVDLSMSIEDHFRWPVERQVKGSHVRGDVFEATWLGWTVHGFTHMDAPRHCVAGGPTTEQIELERTVGEAAVVDLNPIEPNQAITEEHLAGAGQHIGTNEIVILKSCWEQQRSPRTPEFWTDAPYMTRDAAVWLLARQPRAVGFDFPQDYAIRLLLKGESRPLEENVTHDVLLANGIILIEYLSNTAALAGPRTFLCCLPLKVPHADGAPARVVAFEDS